jgi:hypothetical protein
MRISAFVAVALAVTYALPAAQETKPLKKDEVRVSIPGCTKGYIFTAGPRTEEHPGSTEIPPGAHLRMNGPKKLISEIKAHEGSSIEITGTMKKGQFDPSGVGIGGGVRLGQPPQSGGNTPGLPGGNQIMIDLEGWRPITGDCPAR